MEEMERKNFIEEIVEEDLKQGVLEVHTLPEPNGISYSHTKAMCIDLELPKIWRKVQFAF